MKLVMGPMLDWLFENKITISFQFLKDFDFNPQNSTQDSESILEFYNQAVLNTRFKLKSYFGGQDLTLLGQLYKLVMNYQEKKQRKVLEQNLEDQEGVGYGCQFLNLKRFSGEAFQSPKSRF